MKPDFAEVSEDVSVRVRVLMNDRQLNQTIDSSSLSVIHDGRHGHAVFERDKALIKYTPNDPNNKYMNGNDSAEVGRIAK